MALRVFGLFLLIAASLPAERWSSVAATTTSEFRPTLSGGPRALESRISSISSTTARYGIPHPVGRSVSSRRD